MEQNTKKIKDLKNRKFTAYAAVLIALVLAVAIPLNLLASRLNIIWDMTPAKMYVLSDTTKEYLDKLNESDTVVDFYFLMDMDYLETDDNSMALFYSLKQYSEYDCINFVDFDPNSEPALINELNPDGVLNLTTGDMIIRHGENFKHIPGTNMYEYEVSNTDSGNSVVEAAYFTGENYITGAIDAVVSGRNSKVYFLTGHGEKTLQNDYRTFHANLSNYNYVAEELNLTSEPEVPEDASIIIVAAPQTDISNDEARKLNAYLDKGGNVSFLMSPNDDDVIYKNIESIMRDFGIGMDYDIVAETDPTVYVGDPYTFQVSLVASDSEYSTDLTGELIDMTNNGFFAYMRNTRSFFRNMATEDKTLQVESLMQTVSKTDALGNSVSSAIGEAYGGSAENHDITDGTPLDLAMYSMSPARNDAKVLVFGTADFIDDVNLQEDYMIIPVYLMLSSITWMYDSDLDMDMGISDKAKDYDYMKMNSEAEANTTAIVFMVVPFIIGLIGAGVWLGRRYS